LNLVQQELPYVELAKLRGALVQEGGELLTIDEKIPPRGAEALQPHVFFHPVSQFSHHESPWQWKEAAKVFRQTEDPKEDGSPARGPVRCIKLD